MTVLAERVAPETGWQVVVYAMLFGNVRLCVGEPGSMLYDRGWCYQARYARDALADVAAWDGQGAPPGRWYKDLQTGETRPEYLTAPP